MNTTPPEQSPHSESPHSESPHSESPHSESPHSESPDSDSRESESRDNGREAIVEVRDLRMSFALKEVLHGVSFAVGRGEIFGFIGPNGAGKTTTIRILSTLLVPSAGDLWVDGIHVVAEPELVRRRIGYMPDYVGVYPGLTVREYLEFFAGAFRLPRKRRRSIIDGVIELTDLGKLVGTEVQVLSKGMRQRLCLAQTLLHDPALLILDEPASGLDPRARIEFRALLKELRSMGKTIFISSHILSELSPICDSVGILEHGELVAHGTVQEILDQLTGGDCVFTVQMVEESSRIAEVLHEHPDIAEVSRQGRQLQFQYTGADQELHSVFALFARERISFTTVSREERDLETIFMRLTKGEVS